MKIDCDCPLDRRLFIYVGKAVKIRNRLQGHVFPRPTTRISPWSTEFTDSPHDHMLGCAIWYMPKEEISIAEAVLIDKLKPARNHRDKGFGDHHLWSLRPCDVEIDAEDLEPSYRNNSTKDRGAKNLPGVYGWYVDHGMEVVAAYQLFGEVFKRMAEPAKFAELEQIALKRLQE